MLTAQTLRLRVGGPDSSYRITAISSATPAVVTVAAFLEDGTVTASPHTFVVGDPIYIFDVVGCNTANGYRKVKTVNQSAGTFTITDTSDVDIICDYPHGGPSGLPYTKFKSGFVGKVANFTVQSSSPRVMFPQSSSDPILIRNIDPDGAPTGSCTVTNSTVPNTGGTGCAIAPVAAEAGEAWLGMLAQLSSRITTASTPGAGAQNADGSYCDGVTLAKCIKEDAVLVAPPPNGYAWSMPIHAAQIWFADRSKTSYLNAAKYWLNNMERGILTPAGNSLLIPNFAYDPNAVNGGLQSILDYIGQTMPQLAMAFDLIRTQMSSGEKTAFLNKMLNDHTDGCTNSAVLQGTTMDIVIPSSGSPVISGAGIGSVVSGDVIIVRTGTPYGTSATGFYRVATVAGDGLSATLTTLYTGSLVGTYTGKPWFKVGSWTSTNCGAWYLKATHAGGNISPLNTKGYFSAAAISSTTSTSIPLTSTDYSTLKHLSLPFYIPMANTPDNDYELMKATAITPTSLTVERGADGSTAYTHPGKTFTAGQRDTGFNLGVSAAFNIPGDWRYNLVSSTVAGLLPTAAALCGDDSRACDRYEKLFNWSYTLQYARFAALQTSNSLAGMNAYYYQLQRFRDYWIPGVLASRNLTTTPNDIGTQWLWNGLDTPYYFTAPAGNYTPSLVTAQYTTQNTTVLSAVAPLLHPGVDAQHANYWLRVQSGLHTTPNYSSTTTGLYAGYAAAFNPASYTQSVSPYTDLPLWTFANNTELAGIGGNAAMVSKSDWTATGTTIIVTSPVDPTDHVINTASGFPGSHFVMKGPHFLLGSATATGNQQLDVTPSANIVEVGGASSFLTTGDVDWVSPVRKPVLRNGKGTADYVYGLVDATNTYKATANVTNSYVHALHLKGAAEYLVIYNDHRTSTTTTMRSRNVFHQGADTAASFACNVADCSQITLRKPTPLSGVTASVRTAVLFPGTAPGTPVLTSATFGSTTIARTVEFPWPSTTGMEQITVHRIGSDTTAAVPTTRLVTTSDGTKFRGFEVDELGASRVAVFPRSATQYTSSAFRTTFAGPGKIFVAGLSPGSYQVSRTSSGSTTVPYTGQIVGSDGTLMFDATGGSAVDWAITGDGSVTLVVSPPLVSFMATTGGSSPATQIVSNTCPGGSCGTISQTSSGFCSWLAISGTSSMTLTGTIGSLAIGTYNCNVSIAATGAANTPQPLTVVFTVLPSFTTRVSGGVRIQAGGVR